MCDNVEDIPASDGTADTALCATNGVTYPSLCRLLQDTGNEAVAYAGECESEDCNGGPVSDNDNLVVQHAHGIHWV